MITCQFESGNKAKLRHVAFGAIVVKNSKILLGKRAAHLYADPGKWTVPGGYLEQNETIEKGVLRELQEETGYKGKIVSLFRINDNPKRDHSNVDFIYLVKPLKKVGQPDEETEEIKWFDLNKLPAKEQIAFDHHENIQLYLKWQKEKFKLPVFGKI